MEKKSYVVYNGRKTGIYTSLIDCYAQANGYQDCVVRLYDSIRDGKNSWDAYSANCNSSLQTKRNIEAQIDNGCGYVNGILSNILKERCDAEIILEQFTNVLMKKDIQEWLQSACFRFHIEQPRYMLHDHKDDIDGKRYYRYRGSLTTPAIGKSKVCLGDFARTHEKAMDNVAILLLRRLLSSTEHKLVDYNYYNVILLEDQLEKMADENYQLQLENATLLAELKFLSSVKSNDSKSVD